MLKHLIHLLLIITALLSVAGLLGEWSGLLDITSHFRLVYCAILIAGVAYLSFSRQWQLVGIIGTFLIFNLVLVLPLFSPQHPNTANASGPFRLVQLNVWASNRHPQRVYHFLRQSQADLAVMEEYREPMDAALTKLGIRRIYPYKAVSFNARLVVYSQKPLTLYHQSTDPALMKVTTHLGKKPVTLIVAHMTRPFDAHRYGHQVSKLAALLPSPSETTLLIGDLNVTPWSSHFKEIMTQTQFINTQQGFGAWPTYPAYFPKTQQQNPLPVLPIDHILVSRDIAIRSRANGPNVGSDHLPVILDGAFLPP